MLACPDVLDYLKWRALSSLGKHVSRAFADQGFEFEKQVYGVETPKPRWKECVTRTAGAVGFAVGRLYVEKVFAGDSKSRGTQCWSAARRIQGAAPGAILDG